MITREIAKDFLIQRGNTNCETALAAVSALPASGSFIDVRGYARVHIVAHLGSIHASDTPTFEPKCSDAANGTLDRIDASLEHAAANDDDGEFIVWSIETRKLPKDHHFLALAVSGTVANGSYVDVNFFLEGHSLPQAQSAQLPAGSIYAWVG